MTTPTNVYFGGRTHAPDPATPAGHRHPLPLCGVKTRALPRSTSGKVNCVGCLRKLGKPIPDGARRPRVEYAGSGFGWEMTEPGHYRSERYATTNVLKPDVWRLERQPYDPDAGWHQAGWYLFSPDPEDWQGTLMFGPDGDSRLNAAILAANEHIFQSYGRAHARAQRVAEKGL